ncbi:MAG: SMC-Scp complex subunit ScpB [Bacteroidia bacterium]|nr:SMC-Scp complex subunit ScpB [Bacteroidia bacterium]
MSPEKIIEALIFVSDTPVRPAQVEELFQQEEFEGMEMNETQATEIMETLLDKFKSDEFPYELRRIGGGYQFFSKKEYYPYLHQAAVLKNRKKLSRAALETLAIIAYRQPVTKTEVEYIRGVNCDYAVKILLEKKLIEITGRSDAPGRPLLYSTSDFFMEYFGINDLKDLPKLDEFNIDESEFQEQFKIYLEDSEELKEVLDEIKDQHPGANPSDN